MEIFVYFVSIGCLLHILQLLMMGAIVAAFGEQVKCSDKKVAGENGVFRIGFMTHYLIALAPDKWRDWANENGHESIAFLPTGASEGRWWSCTEALQDVSVNKSAYAAFFTYMASAGSPTYDPLYQEVSGWLMNTKLHVDMEYVLAHSAAWWNGYFQWVQSAPPWMIEELPLHQQLGGFRAAELPVKAMLLRWKFLRLNVEEDGHFLKWRESRDKLTPELKEQANMQDIAFRRTLIEIQAKHFERWITTFLPCALLHPEERIGVALGAALLAILDGSPPPVIDDSITVDVDGEAVGLALLIEHLIQFATPAMLTTAPIVLFTREGFVANLREWVRHEGDVTKFPGGLEFREFMRGVIFPMCIHSQAAERGVNASVNTNVAYDTSRSGEVTSAKTSAIFRFRDQQRQAGAEYFEARKRAHAAAAAAEAEYQDEIVPSGVYSHKWRLLAQQRKVLKVDLVRVSKLRNKDTTLSLLKSITTTATKCSDPTFARLVADLQRDLTEQGLTRKQSVQRQRGEACKETAEAVAKKRLGRSGGFSISDREEITASSNPKFPQTATGAVNLDGHGKAEAGFKLSKHWLASELTEWGVEDLWNQNKPDEVRSKYYLGDLIRMLKEKNGGNSIYHPRCGFDGEKKTREWRGLDGSGGWGPTFPVAGTRTPVAHPSPPSEIANARDAMAAEPLDSPYPVAGQYSGPHPQPEIENSRDAIDVDRSRSPSPDGATEEILDSPGRRRKRGKFCAPSCSLSMNSPLC